MNTGKIERNKNKRCLNVSIFSYSDQTLIVLGKEGMKRREKEVITLEKGNILRNSEL